MSKVWPYWFWFSISLVESMGQVFYTNHRESWNETSLGLLLTISWEYDKRLIQDFCDLKWQNLTLEKIDNQMK